MDWEILYYSKNVQELINDWPVGIRAFYARVTERMETFGPNLGMPFTRSMGKGLFEIRAKGKEGIGCSMYCVAKGKEVVILHSFIKKTQKTPKKELDLAKKRMKEVLK